MRTLHGLVHPDTDRRVVGAGLSPKGPRLAGITATVVPLILGVVVAVVDPFSAECLGQTAKASPPDEQAVEAAQKQVRQVFGEQFTNAKTPQDDAALAAKLAQVAEETGSNPAVRYALLRMAAQRSAESGRLAAGLKLVDRLGELYAVDVLSLKADLLAHTADLLKAGKRILAEGENLRDAFWSLLDEAVAADKYVLAKRLADLAVSIARKARNAELIREFGERGREIERLRKEYEPVAAALQAIQTDPVDAAANLTVGQWRCFRKGDWDRGLPMLALGNDAALSGLARRELSIVVAQGSEGKEILAIADAWVELGKRKSEPLKPEMESHAATCIRLALPKLTGLEKASAEKRIRDLEIAVSESAATGATARGLVQRGNVALATNGTTVTGEITNAQSLLDGNAVKYDAGAGYASGKLPCEWTFAFKRAYLLREIRFLLWDLDVRTFRYRIAVSADGNTFAPLIDRSQGDWRSWQRIEFRPRVVKAIKFFGVSGSVGDCTVVEFEAYCVPSKPFRK